MSDPRTTRDLFDAALRGKCITQDEHDLLCKGLGDDGYLIHPAPVQGKCDPEVYGVHASLRSWLNPSALDVAGMMRYPHSQDAFVRADDLGKVLALHTALKHSEPLYRWGIDAPARQVPAMVAALYETGDTTKEAIRMVRAELGLPEIPQ